MIEKEFDAVKMMRDIRDKLHKRYQKSPELLKQDLEKVREKYMHLVKKQKVA